MDQLEKCQRKKKNVFLAQQAPGTNSGEYNEAVPREADWRKANEEKKSELERKKDR